MQYIHVQTNEGYDQLMDIFENKGYTTNPNFTGYEYIGCSYEQ